MDIRPIEASSTYPLRRALLRPHQPTDEVRFPGDEDSQALHLGLFIGVTLVGIASFLPESLPERPGGYRLRGMAIVPSVQRQGLGTAMVRYGLEQLKARQAAYVWANARVSAVPFYEGLGFRTISREFVLPGIGPHQVIVLEM